MRSSSVASVCKEASVALLRTPRRATARIALHTSAVPHQREIPALAAHFAFVAAGFRLGTTLGLAWRRGRSRPRLAPGHRLDLLGRRQLGLQFLLQRGGAFHGVADA